jgi:hypothetical protein
MLCRSKGKFATRDPGHEEYEFMMDHDHNRVHRLRVD